MSETKFGAWAVPQTNVAVEYSLVVIEEIRQAVTEGFQRFARGGIEVGGILYGTYDGKTARLLAVREIACEHAHGPSFVLSDKDRAALTEQIERDKLDVRLEGFQALGLYVSHTRSEIVLQKSDQETYEAFFPELWQVALVVKPGRAGAMRAGFFVREIDGTVKTDSSHLDFNFPERIAMPAGDRALDRARERAPAGDRRGAAPQDAAPGMEAFNSAFPQQRGILFPGPEAGAQQSRAPEYMPYPENRRSWQSWAIAALVVLLVAFIAGIGLRYYGAHAPAEPISLSVYEHDGQLRIEWNHDAAPIRSATRGSLEIVDGKDTKTLMLSTQELQRGSFTYARHSGDVQVRLEAQNANGEKTQEASRFLGAAPHADAAVAADANETDTVRLERDALKDEVTRLRTENAAQATRVQQLERTLAILRLRLGIQTPDKQ